MKGATIDPFARISKAPSKTIKIMIGASHNFLRERKKDHSSFIKDTIDRSKLIFKSCRRRVFVGSLDPI